MAISMKEMLKDKKLEDLPEEHAANLAIVLERINKVREKYGKPMTPTSVYRSLAEHLAIYAKKGITDKKLIPMGSGHLRGECVDIADPKGELRDWVLKNLDFVQELGFWFEDFRYTKGWVHFSIKPPTSNKRIFVPFSGPVPNPELWGGQYDSKYDKIK